MLGFCSLFLLIGYVVLVKLIAFLVDFIQQITYIFEILKRAALTFGEALYLKLTSVFPLLDQHDFEKQVDQLMDNLSASSMNVLTNTIQFTSTAFSSFSYSIFVFIFILLGSYMLTKDFILVKQQTTKIIPKNIAHYFAPVLKHVKKSFLGLIQAQIIITFISSLLFFIGMVIFQVEHAFTIAITIFAVDFIPYVGLGIVLIPWIVYLFLTGQYTLTIEMTGIYIIVILIRQFLEPRLIAKTIGLHPFIALTILFIGFQLFGMIGIVLTPFILIAVSAFYQAGIFHALWHYLNDG
jgi:sporulation integral membrane protein YtvI